MCIKNLSMIIGIRVRLQMDGRLAVCNWMKYQIFWSKLLKASYYKTKVLLLLFLFCIFTVFSFGCLHEICSLKLTFSLLLWFERGLLGCWPFDPKSSAPESKLLTSGPRKYRKHISKCDWGSAWKKNDKPAMNVRRHIW